MVVEGIMEIKVPIESSYFLVAYSRKQSPYIEYYEKVAN